MQRNGCIVLHNSGKPLNIAACRSLETKAASRSGFVRNLVCLRMSTNSQIKAASRPNAQDLEKRQAARTHFPKFARPSTPPDFGEELRIARRFTHIRILTNLAQIRIWTPSEFVESWNFPDCDATWQHMSGV